MVVYLLTAVALDRCSASTLAQVRTAFASDLIPDQFDKVRFAANAGHLGQLVCDGNLG
jgi:hypothetical protein